MRTRQATLSIADGRFTKAQQFARVARDVLDLADESRSVADAFVTLAVHSGIASSDVVCCVRLGEYHYGGEHSSAVSLLGRVDRDLAKALRNLLDLKTKAGYSDTPVPETDRRRAERAMDLLLEAATQVSARIRNAR